MVTRLPVLLTLLVAAGIAFAGTRYSEAYADAVWSDLTGLSSSQSVQVGTKNGKTNLYLSLRNEWYDTTGTDLPFQYQARGTSIGAGIGRRVLNDRIVMSLSVGKVIDGPDPGKVDVRAGVSGYDSWEQDKCFTDLYGELTWVSRADDAFLYARYRPGVTLKRDEDGRLWAYGVGALWASGEGDIGTENRVEAGVGIGYIYHDHLTANIDLRAGHSFSGAISDRNYFNPMIILAGNF